MKKRSTFVAVLLNSFFPGLGFLYCGRAYLAIMSMLLYLGIFMAFAWSRAFLTTTGYWAFIASLILASIFLMVGAYRAAKSSVKHERKAFQRWYYYLLFIVATQLITASVLINREALLGYSVFRIPSNSMADTFIPGDYILADFWAYRTESPEPWDVVLVKYQENEEHRFLARIIGLPGDTVSISRDGLFINKIPKAEPYVLPENTQKATPSLQDVLVPENSYFVLGDNRDNSNDSRYRGFVTLENVKARVTAVIYSQDPGRIRGIPRGQ